MTEKIKSKFLNFANALDLAVYDRLLELGGNTPIFFYDADVLYNLIAGYLAEQPIKLSHKKRLVRALLANGYFGHFYVLRAHEKELFENIKLLQSEVREGFYRNAALDFIRRAGISESMDKLATIVDEIDKTPNKKQELTQLFIRTLKNSPSTIFAFIEQINGGWSQRLRKYFDTGYFDRSILGPHIADLIASNDIAVRSIYRELKKDRLPKYTKNAYQDAIALVALSELIKSEFPGKVVRFYTETSKLEEKIYFESVVNRYLRDKTFFDEMYSTPAMICRNADYFLVRMMFPELAITENKTSKNDLQYLIDVAKATRTLQSVDSDALEDELKRQNVHGLPLINIVNNLEELAIMDQVWAKVDAPKALNQFEDISSWVNVYNFAKDKLAIELITSEIQDIKEQFEASISRISTWANDANKITNDARQLREQVRNAIENPERDLGLVRWGIYLTTEEKDRLKQIIPPFLDSEEGELTPIAGFLASKLQLALKNQQEIDYIYATLWTLGCFQTLYDFTNRLGSASKSEFPHLELMGIAAGWRSQLVRRDEEKELLKIVELVVDKAPEDKKKDLYLGAGYIYFQAWKRATVNLSVRQKLWKNQGNALKSFATKSWEYGKRAFKAFPGGTLQWAFAVNHCTYVGIVTDVGPVDYITYLEKLIQLEVHPEYWTARFADTIGTVYLTRAERLWHDKKKNVRYDEIVKNLSYANEYLLKAKDKDTGDTDVNEHISRAGIIEELLKTKGPRKSSKKNSRKP